MGSRRHDRNEVRIDPVRHVWFTPRHSGPPTPVQALVIEKMKRADGWWCRIAYVSTDKPPTLIDTWVLARLCVPVPSPPREPNY